MNTDRFDGNYVLELRGIVKDAYRMSYEDGVAFIKYKDKNREEIGEYSLLDLEIKESEILRKSEELFSDNDPCVINRTYAKNRLCFKVEEILSRVEREEDIVIEDLGDKFNSIVEVPEGAYYLAVR